MKFCLLLRLGVGVVRVVVEGTAVEDTGAVAVEIGGRGAVAVEIGGRGAWRWRLGVEGR